MWHVSSRSGVATLRTAIHLLLTYLLILTYCANGRIALRTNRALTVLENAAKLQLQLKLQPNVLA